jgi:hypothetical protein
VATLHLMFGLPCSGKTTLAHQRERERAALRLTPDEWHLRLFGQDVEEPEHDARHNLIETLLWDVAARALALGTNVILDSAAGRETNGRTFVRGRGNWAPAMKCISWMCRRQNCCVGSRRGVRRRRLEHTVSLKN